MKHMMQLLLVWALCLLAPLLAMIEEKASAWRD